MKPSFVVALFVLALVQLNAQKTPAPFVQDSIVLTATIRDFWGGTTGNCWTGDAKNPSQCGHTGLAPADQFNCLPTQCFPDFETMCCGAPEGAVGAIGVGQLDAQGKPVLVADGYSGLWTTKENFAKWYRDTPGVNIPIGINLTFVNSQSNTRIYSYASSSFFPINGRGFGNYYANQNFHFTTEVKARFVYNGGETFTFSGDDDLWVFINNRLAVDIGGIHSAANKSIDLDEKATLLNLTKGVNYPFSIFHAERHTTESNFNAFTSIALYCPWSDWCGVCQGNGQTCCKRPGTNINLCEDNNPCTNDFCNVMNGTCNNIPYTCPSTDNNMCTVDFCDTTVSGSFNISTHCKVKPLDCNDGLACTEDQCFPSSGCSSTNKVCDDQNDCTTNTCNNATGCAFPTKSCNDGNACTDDSCNIVGGCQNAEIFCNDDNACTTDSCNPATGCVFTPISCNDSDGCTVDSCDAIAGCTHVKKNCDDRDYCTADTCDSSTVNGCVNTRIPCTLCSNPDLLPCISTDPCNPKACNPANGNCEVKYTVTCDDNNACTVDTCSKVNDTEYSCSNVQQVCNLRDACVPEVCDRSNGVCVQQQDQAKTCNDNNACTADSCNPTTGNCEFVPINCGANNTNPCTVDTCDANTGCMYTPYVDVYCTDNNKCTTKSCAVNGTEGSCVRTNVECSSDDLCQIPSCDPTNGCLTTAKDCDDGNPCTVDTCVAGNCTHVPIVLPNYGKCNTSYCDPVLGILTSPVTCKPADRCTCDPNQGCMCDDSLWNQLGTTAKGIGGGIIAAIVIAAVVTVAALVVGGKKGLDVLRNSHIAAGSVHTNPTYEGNAMEHDNPMYNPSNDV